MHVVQLQTHSPKAPPKSSNTGHAFVAATAKMPTVAEAVGITEQLRMSQEAANLQVQTALFYITHSFHLCSWTVARTAVAGNSAYWMGQVMKPNGACDCSSLFISGKCAYAG